MTDKCLVLPPRYTEDTISMSRAASAAGWQTLRLASWRAPVELCKNQVVLYGEPLFVAVVAQELELALVEPTLNWLTTLSRDYAKRELVFGSHVNRCRIEFVLETAHRRR